MDRGSRIADRESPQCTVMMGVWACQNAPPKFKKLIFLWYKREGKHLQITNICSSRHTLLYTMQKPYFTGLLKLSEKNTRRLGLFLNQFNKTVVDTIGVTLKPLFAGYFQMNGLYPQPFGNVSIPMSGCQGTIVPW